MWPLFSVLETLAAVMWSTARFRESWFQSCCLTGALVLGTYIHSHLICYEEIWRKDNQNCSVVLCTTVVHSTHEQSINLHIVNT